MVPVPVLAFLHFGSVPVWAYSITWTGIPTWCLYWYWHFCTQVQYQYRNIPLPVLAFHCARTGIGILALWLSTSMGTYHYRYWCFVWPSTGTGISALLCSTNRGTFHYRYWHSTMVSVLVWVFLHFGSVPVKAQSITRSVTARIGLYVESDLSMYFQEILQTNLLDLFGFAGNTKIDPILREIQF